MIEKEDIHYLEELARAVANASEVAPLAQVGSWKNELGFRFLKPGGLDCYPSFWIRDFVMSAECGIISQETLSAAFICIAEHQAKEDIHLPSGALVPSGSIPDHIRPDGVPIYFPGTYEPSQSGGAVWGYRPAMDDNFFFIHLAGALNELDLSKYGNALKAAFTAVTCDTDGVVECTEQNRGVSFGFSDSVFQTGKLLWATLLKERAASVLSDIFARAENTAEAQHYAAIRAHLKEIIPVVFAHDSGLLLSATGTCRQPDTWGSAYALYYDLVPRETADNISDALANFYKDGAIACEGQICHVPRPYFASDSSCWEKSSCGIPVNVYQNGSYWATPTGWVAIAIAQKHPDDAKKLFSEYIQHLRSNDFRKQGKCGAPWECIYPANCYYQNAVYLTSVTCPLAAVCPP